MGGIFGGGGPKGPSKAERDSVARREASAKAQESATKRSIAARRNAASKGNTLLMMTDRDNPQVGIKPPEELLGAGRNPRDKDQFLMEQAKKTKKSLG